MEGCERKHILIDTHCHLNDPAFSGIVNEVLSRAASNGVAACVVPSYDRISLAKTHELARCYPGLVFPAYGVHPWYLWDGAVDDLEFYLKQPGTVAVGESGLDFSPQMSRREAQEQVLLEQLDMAVRLHLPVILHCRKAHDRLFSILRGYAGKIGMVMHSFSGGVEAMKRFLDLGCYISFSGSVTRDGAKKYHSCAQEVPQGQLLLETDAPSIATQTTVASRVEPYHTAEVAQKIALIRGVSFEQVCDWSSANARRVFAIPGAGEAAR